MAKWQRARKTSLLRFQQLSIKTNRTPQKFVRVAQEEALTSTKRQIFWQPPKGIVFKSSQTATFWGLIRLHIALAGRRVDRNNWIKLYGVCCCWVCFGEGRMSRKNERGRQTLFDTTTTKTSCCLVGGGIATANGVKGETTSYFIHNWHKLKQTIVSSVCATASRSAFSIKFYAGGLCFHCWTSWKFKRLFAFSIKI